jgi:hypothetical protein
MLLTFVVNQPTVRDALITFTLQDHQFQALELDASAAQQASSSPWQQQQHSGHFTGKVLQAAPAPGAADAASPSDNRSKRTPEGRQGTLQDLAQ